MHNISYEKLLKELDSIDTKDRLNNTEIKKDNSILQLVKKNITYEEVSVLGFDIYEYSQYDLEKQSLIPFVFDILYKEAIKICLMNEEILFEKNEFDDKFISTGDGGFFIFKNPLQAIVFNTFFFGLLHAFNSCRLYPKLREFIGPLTIRSCISSDKIYHYENNYFGPAIITNARILSRDKLNRFLIDEKTYLWFLTTLNGIENLPEITFENLDNAKVIYNTKNFSAFFSNEEEILKRIHNREASKFKNCHVQKIGTISVKKTPLSVYNVELQAYIYFVEDNNNLIGRCFTVSIGNLNCTGIGDI